MSVRARLVRSRVTNHIHPDSRAQATRQNSYELEMSH